MNKKTLSTLLALAMCLSMSAQTKALYDFVVPRDGNFRQAIDKANTRTDKKKRFRIFVMQGNYAIPTEGTTVGSDNENYPDPRTYLKVPNTSIIGEDRDSTVLVNTVPAPSVESKYGLANPLEGIGKGDVLIIEKKCPNTYIQDITMQSGMADATGRNIVLNDKSGRTIAKNICIWGYQDTYVSNNEKEMFYFEGGIIRGRTDYICGKGDVVYNGVTFQQCGQGGYLAVPSRPKKYGYVMLNCYVKSETPDVTWFLGRPWGQGTPTALYINTVVDKAPIAKDKKGNFGWHDMSNGWPARFAEYNTTVKSTGAAVDLSTRRTVFKDKEGNEHTNNPILTAEEAKEYTLQNIFGDWDPTKDTKDATAPTNVVIKKKQLSWTGSDDALLYAVCKNGKVIDFTTETTIKVKGKKKDVWSVRSANQMGGLGQAVEAARTKK